MGAAPAPAAAPARVGLVGFWKSYNRRTMLRAVEMADEAGYDSFWVPEAWGYEAFALLTEMALRTKRIRLGTGIVNVFSRSAGLLAMSAATLDEISEGRFVLGLGTSGQRLVEEFHRVAYARPLARLREALTTLRRLLRGDATAAERSAIPLGIPRRRRDIPVYCGCIQPRAVELVGELADGWMPMFWSSARIGEGLALLRRGAARAGRDPSDVTVAPFTGLVSEGAEREERTVRRMVAFYVGGMGPSYHETLTRLGLGPSADRVRELWAANRWREAEAAVSADLIDALAVTGSVDDCRRRLRDRAREGVDLSILILPVPAIAETVYGFIEKLAPGR